VRAVAQGRGGFPGWVRQCSGKQRKRSIRPFRRTSNDEGSTRCGVRRPVLDDAGFQDRWRGRRRLVGRASSPILEVTKGSTNVLDELHVLDRGVQCLRCPWMTSRLYAARPNL
jgi:hypothetical protein